MSSSRRKGFGPALAGLVVLALAGGAAWWFLAPDSKSVDSVPTFRVARGPLRISVTEGGSLQSLKSAVVSSEVEGSTKIMVIVPEGTSITADDVEKGRVLVELDSSDIRTKLNRQEISVSDAQANLAQSVGKLDIQLNQNASDIRKADLDVRFARLDLDKYLGAPVAGKALTSVNADGKRTLPDVKTVAEDAELEGEALQEMRKLKSEIDLSDEEVARARDKLAGTEKLLSKGYVSQDELIADRLALKRQEVSLDQAKTALSLFLAYSLPKQVEKLWSDLLESEETLSRVKKQADSSRRQAEADRKSKEEKLRLETYQFSLLERQLAACVIKATTPGLVVYASSEDRGDWREGQPIQAGTAVRQREAIISIPDPKRMGVRVNVHESALDKVKIGQPVVVTIDAFAERPLAGRIERLATLPSGSNRWQNPDLKLYPTDIVLDDPPANLRPGMSARVEILVKDIESTLSVPVQAIGYAAGRPMVWVRSGADFTARPARLGLSNDRFTEVLDGVSDGDVVSLAPPKEAQKPGGSSERRGAGKGAPKTTDPAGMNGSVAKRAGADTTDAKGASDAGPAVESKDGASAPAASPNPTPAAVPAATTASPAPPSIRTTGSGGN